MSVALVTDSTAYLPSDLRERHGISVVPLHVVIGGRERQEGVDVGADEVARALHDFAPVSTSRPAPQAFYRAYEKAAQAGAEAIVSVHISSDMSSTIQSARLAADEAPVPVEVVDSRSMGMAMGFAVVTGAELAERGADPARVASAVRARCASATVAFYVDTLEHLRRGGRIGAASAFLGSALAIKPILGFADGRIVPLEKVRTASRALARLEELAVEACEAAGDAGVDVAIHHLDARDRADTLTEHLADRVAGLHDLREVELGAVVGAHVGPGTLAVSVSPRPQEV
jgi:DegV family protein with EDD domain